MRYLILSLVVTLLSSCGVGKMLETVDYTSRTITNVVDTTNEVIRKVDAVMAKVEDTKVAIASADTNGDGKLSIGEMLALASLVLGSGTAAKVGMNKASQRRHNANLYSLKRDSSA